MAVRPYLQTLLLEVSFLIGEIRHHIVNPLKPYGAFRPTTIDLFTEQVIRVSLLQWHIKGA